MSIGCINQAPSKNRYLMSFSGNNNAEVAASNNKETKIFDSSLKADTASISQKTPQDNKQTKKSNVGILLATVITAIGIVAFALTHRNKVAEGAEKAAKTAAESGYSSAKKTITEGSKNAEKTVKSPVTAGRDDTKTVLNNEKKRTEKVPSKNGIKSPLNRREILEYPKELETDIKKLLSSKNHNVSVSNKTGRPFIIIKNIEGKYNRAYVLNNNGTALEEAMDFAPGENKPFRLIEFDHAKCIKVTNTITNETRQFK